jgi:hypothetical protein
VARTRPAAGRGRLRQRDEDASGRVALIASTRPVCRSEMTFARPVRPRATQRGLGDPESDVLATARSRWAGWVSAHPVPDVVEDLLELPAWLRQAERDDADRVLLTLAKPSSRRVVTTARDGGSGVGAASPGECVGVPDVHADAGDRPAAGGSVVKGGEDLPVAAGAQGRGEPSDECPQGPDARRGRGCGC